MTSRSRQQPAGCAYPASAAARTGPPSLRLTTTIAGSCEYRSWKRPPFLSRCRSTGRCSAGWGPGTSVPSPVSPESRSPDCCGASIGNEVLDTPGTGSTGGWRHRLSSLRYDTSKHPTETCAMKLLLVRHGQCETNLGSRFQGQVDSPLTELGRKQARAAAEKLWWSATALRAASWRRSIARNDDTYR